MILEICSVLALSPFVFVFRTYLSQNHVSFFILEFNNLFLSSEVFSFGPWKFGQKFFAMLTARAFEEILGTVSFKDPINTKLERALCETSNANTSIQVSILSTHTDTAHDWELQAPKPFSHIVRSQNMITPSCRRL